MKSIGSLLVLPHLEVKELSTREKKWSIQREIFDLIETPDQLRMFNWSRYIAFLKKYKYNQQAMGQAACIKKWKQCNKIKADADVRKILPMTKGTFGFFTAHLDEDALWYLLSVCRDRVQRGECVTTYILSLQKYEK
jgi:hypothetical protein